MTFLSAAIDPTTSPWFYLANFGVTGIILGAILLAVSRDKWGSHSERDRLRQMEDRTLPLLVDILSFLRQDKERGEQTIASVVALKDMVTELGRLRDDLVQERNEYRIRSRPPHA